MNDKVIYFVRHGESTGNVNPNDLRLDPPLTELGREQASKVQIETDLIICSPMRRALETLYYSKIYGNKVVLCDDVREKRCGPSDHMLFETKNIETQYNFYDRIQRVAEMLLELPQKEIVVVCHGCLIAALTGKYLKNAEVIQANNEAIQLLARGAIYPVKCCSKKGW